MMHFAAVLNKLFTFVEFLFARWKKADAQKQRDQVERNPYGRFSTHFNGVSDSNNQRACQENFHYSDQTRAREARSPEKRARSSSTQNSQIPDQ